MSTQSSTRNSSTPGYYYCVDFFDDDGKRDHTATCRTLDELANVANGRALRIEVRYYPCPNVIEAYESDENQKAIGNPDFQHI